MINNPPQNLNASSLGNTSVLSNHPIFSYLPNTFKQELLNLEHENENLKLNPSIPLDQLRASNLDKSKQEDKALESDEKMLDYLRL